MSKASESAVGHALFGSRHARAELHPDRQKLLNHIGRNPWNFVTAEDPITKEPLVWTRNENSKRGKDPFPHKDYLHTLFDMLRAEPVLLIPKSRQMIISTGCLVLCLWEIMFEQSWRTILSKVTEEDAEELLDNKVRFTYERLPAWLKAAKTIPVQPKGKATCKQTASYILAAAQNVADRECRGGTANRVIIDEACYQDHTRTIVEAGQPMTQRMVLVSSPNVSYPGGRFMRKIVFDEVEDM